MCINCERESVFEGKVRRKERRINPKGIKYVNCFLIKITMTAILSYLRVRRVFKIRCKMAERAYLNNLFNTNLFVAKQRSELKRITSGDPKREKMNKAKI